MRQRDTDLEALLGPLPPEAKVAAERMWAEWMATPLDVAELMRMRPRCGISLRDYMLKPPPEGT